MFNLRQSKVNRQTITNINNNSKKNITCKQTVSTRWI